jgi:GWxTD domain-containing protein
MSLDRSLRRLLAILLLLVVLAPGGLVLAQDSGKEDKASSGGQHGQAVDPLKRPLTEKQRQEQEKALKQELGKTYKKWLDEDVRWIITDEERAAFKQLSNDEERDQFIEQFWLRRDPTPDTIENEYKEEHYRRIAYANEHFAAGVAGWRTDRGRIYVMYGPPDQIDDHPSGGTYQRPPEEGGGMTSTYPFETWRYRYLEGVGQEVMIEFVDRCMCGEYRMTMDPSEKDALFNVPGAGLTTYEEMGLASKAQRLGSDQYGPVAGLAGARFHEFERLELFAKLQRAPQIKFKDLAEVVSHKISVNLMPFEVRADFIRVTSDTVLVPVTLQIKNRDITFNHKDGVARGVVNIFGRVTTLTGRIAQTFEDTVTVDQPDELLPRALEGAAVYWKALPLRPGRYRLDIVTKDVNSDRIGTWSKGIVVPQYDEDKLASSSLIVADVMEKVPTKDVGAGNFVIGATKVRPRMEGANGQPATFARGQKANFWMQVYNLAMDQQTHRPSATIEYEVTSLADNKAVVQVKESTADMGNVGEQITLEKSLPLNGFKPGVYQIAIKVRDHVSNQQLAQSARFAVE